VSLLLLDTTFLIDAERRGLDLDDAIGDDDDVAIAAVTVAELLVGVKLASGKRRAARQAYVDDVIGSLPIIPYDIGVAVEHSELLATVREEGRPRGTDRTVVSADLGAFAGLPGVATISHR